MLQVVMPYANRVVLIFISMHKSMCNIVSQKFKLELELCTIVLYSIGGSFCTGVLPLIGVTSTVA